VDFRDKSSERLMNQLKNPVTITETERRTTDFSPLFSKMRMNLKTEIKTSTFALTKIKQQK
jgi:hypothetical protein